MTLTLPAFLDALVADLNSGPAPHAWLTYNELANALTKARAKLDEHPTPALGWSEWLDWAGGPCPLPDTTGVEVELVSGVKIGRDVASARWWAHNVPSTGVIKRFRYATDDPSGWLPRGDFVPPAALWDEACPVRCEWTLEQAPIPLHAGGKGRLSNEQWGVITHIRLLPRAKAGEACEMPEGFSINARGHLCGKHGALLVKSDLDRYGPDTIRRAVDAWLASMKERGNG